jgi:serine/threonine protein kinase
LVDIESLFSHWSAEPGQIGEKLVFSWQVPNTSRYLAIKWILNIGIEKTPNQDEWVLLKELPFHPNIVQYLSHFSFTPPIEFISRIVDPSILSYVAPSNLLGARVPRKQDFMILEFFQRGSLAEFLYRTRNQPSGFQRFETQLLRICQDVAEGVKFLFGQRIVHRDLKLENLLISRCGVVSLCDFSLALQLPDSEMTALLSLDDPTGGNPAHLAPEVRFAPVEGNNRKVNYKFQPSWELGVLFFEIIFGHSPFPTICDLETVPDIRAIAVQTRNTSGVEIPEKLLDLIERCLRTEGALRPSVEEICLKLNELVGQRDDLVEISPSYFLVNQPAVPKKVIPRWVSWLIPG